MKQLSELTLEELWELFPVILIPHKDYWKLWYIEETILLKKVLQKKAIINHIGSTAINGIWAKPTIDILIEADIKSFVKIEKTILTKDYLCMAKTNSRIDFNKGYTSLGYAERVFHLHLRKFGDNAELYFRDYLNDNQKVAKEYEKLKLSIWKENAHNRNRYIEQKSEFINKITQDAIKYYGKKYERNIY